MSNSTPLPAGDFSAWLADVQAAIAGEVDGDVPCGGCTGCCTSSQFIHIAPDETDTLAHIDPQLMFPAPLLPRGHVVLGYDERGRCPMLVDNICSIYEHLPRTCRTYDCRIFPATGIEPGSDKIDIGERTRRWRFSFPTANDRTDYDAVHAAAEFIGEHPDVAGDNVSTLNSTERAVLAVLARDAFVSVDEAGRTVVVQPTADHVRVTVRLRSRT